MQKDIEAKYNDVYSSKILATNNFILAQNQTMYYQNMSKSLKYEQKKKLDGQLKIRDDLRNNIIDIIENLGQQGMISERKRENYKVMINKLRDEIEKFNRNFHKDKEMEKQLVFYRGRFEIINKIVHNHDAKFSRVEPLNAKSIKTIIRVFNEMAFQEASLSDRFQELTNDEINKKHICLGITKQLEILKGNEDLYGDRIGNISTFNQKKMILDDKELVRFKTDELERIEKFLLRAFFQILSFGSILLNTFTKISNFSKDSALSIHLLSKAGKTIKELNKGFGYPIKETSGIRVQKKRFTYMPEKQYNTFKTDLDVSPKDGTNYYCSLSDIDVSKAYFLFFSNNTDERKINPVVSKDPIICYFLNRKNIEKYFEEQSNQAEIFSNVWQLNQLAHTKLQEQLRDLSDIIRDLIWHFLKNVNASKTEEIVEKTPLLSITRSDKSRLMRRETKISSSSKKFEPSSRDESEGSQNNFRVSEFNKTEKEDTRSPAKADLQDDSLCTEYTHSLIKFRSSPTKKMFIPELTNKAVLQEMKEIKGKLKEMKILERKANQTNVDNKKLLQSPRLGVLGSYRVKPEEDVGSTQPTRPSTYSVSGRKYQKSKSVFK